MPGTPDPTFGHEYLDAIAAGGVALAVVGTLYSVGGSVDDPLRFAVGSGIGYALVCFGAYVLPRVVYDAFVPTAFTPQHLALILAFMLPSLVALGGVPAYLYATYGSVGALLGLFFATVLVVSTHQGVGGESGLVVLYPTVLPPLAAVAIAVPVVLEFAARLTVAGVAL